jgi:hypothetical protein
MSGIAPGQKAIELCNDTETPNYTTPKHKTHKSTKQQLGVMVL